MEGLSSSNKTYFKKLFNNCYVFLFFVMWSLLDYLPEIRTPKQRIDFNSKLKWTFFALVSYFVLSMIPLYGLSQAYKAQFESLSVLLAANFGSVLSLGIGPLVTASIILQLLVSVNIINVDLKTQEGKVRFQKLQKIFSIGFVVLENSVFVISGALPAATPTLFNELLLIIQLVIGGLILLYLDELTSKYGLGSGISLFIAAGVSLQIITAGLSPFPDPTNPSLPSGQAWKVVVLFLNGLVSEAFWPLVSIVATVFVFSLSVYLQSMKVEIPLSFGRFRGMSIKWPLKFIYTSNMPVILVAAFIASLQFWGVMFQNLGFPILGSYEPGLNGRMVAVSGIGKYLTPPTIRQLVEAPTFDSVMSFFVYLFLLSFGSIVFSVLWVSIGNQDPSSVAEQIVSSNLQIPGFRQDKRVIERVLARYIMPLTVVGGFSVGVLAAFADLLGALSRGTGILLSVMIVYNLYETITKQHFEEAHPLIKKFLK